MDPLKRVVSKKLGDLLIERKIITSEQLQKALAVQKEKGGLLGQILVSLEFATEEEIAQALTVQYGFPYLPLASYEVGKEALKTIPENVARQYCLIAIDKIGNTLTIAMSNPLNTQAIEDIELISKSKIQVFVSTMTDVTNALDKNYGKDK
jgi:type IV pilus assembly protein PilB